MISLAVFAAGSAFQFFSDFSPVCKGQTALLFGSLMIERAASSAIAVISETKAKGLISKIDGNFSNMKNRNINKTLPWNYCR